jgi:hypothetical protein
MSDNPNPETINYAVSPGLAVRARKLSWRAGLLLAGGVADNPVAVAVMARPVAEWFADAEDDADLRTRMDAAAFHLDALLELARHGVDPDPDGDPGEAFLHGAAGVHAWLTDVPRYGEVAPARPRPAVTGRQLYVARCLLLRATEQGTGEPGLLWDTLKAGAREYAGTVSPPVTAAEIDNVLRLIFCGDPYDTGAGAAGVGTGRVPCGAEADAPAAAGAGLDDGDPPARSGALRPSEGFGCAEPGR